MLGFDNFEVVLCRAEEAGNVGAACRAMKTMGFHRLSLAARGDYSEELVRTFAVHAYDVYESARRFPDLDRALAGCTLAAGFTRRTGRTRSPVLMDVREFAPYALNRKGEIALVFGNERDGLSRAEIALCDIAVYIPSSREFPSINLAQAVQIACWELARNMSSRGEELPLGTVPPLAGAPVDHVRVNQAVGEILDNLSAIGFFRVAGRPEMARYLRSLIARARLNGRELDYFSAIFQKAASLIARNGPESLTPESSGARVSQGNSAKDVPKGDSPCDD